MNTLKSLIDVMSIICSELEVDPRSIASIKRRAESEGILFLTVQLPTLGKNLEQALESGQLVVTGRFKPRSKTTVLPTILYELFVLIFDRNGDLLKEANPEAIKTLRQILLMFYKFETPFTPEQEREAYEKFLDVDRSVKTDDWHWTLPIVRKHFESLLPGSPFDIRGHHSSGATADKISNYEKRCMTRFIPSLHNHFDYGLHFQGYRHLSWRLGSKKPLIEEPNAKLQFVPKDSRAPRSICMEPHERMFFQKGLQTMLYDFIENDSPAKGKINFRDQSINRDYAKDASVNRAYATIDLQDASDLVSNPLILALLRDKKDWRMALTATRSTCVSYEGVVTPMKKFAAMGSALCFPIEAMLFWSIIRPITSDVRVYGDDIIVPACYAEKVMHRLEQYGLKINRGKSFVNGFFRESCGGDYYKGHHLPIVRLKSLSTERYVAFCNEITVHYGNKMARALIAYYEKIRNIVIVRAPLSKSMEPRPFVFYTHGCASNSVFFNHRYDKALQKTFIRVPTVSTVNVHCIDQNDDLLFDWFTTKCGFINPEAEFVDEQYKHQLDDPKGLSRDVFDDLSRDTPTKNWDGNPRTKFSWLPLEVVA